MSITLIASVAAGANSVAPATTSAIDTTGATLLVASCGDWAHDSTTDGITDSRGNTWHALANQKDPANGANTTIFYAADHAGAALSTGSGHTFTAAGSYLAILITAWTGTATAAPLDQQSGAALSSSQALTLPSLTPSTAGSLCITAVCTAAQQPILITGYTIAVTMGATLPMRASLAYLIQTTAVAAAPTWSYTTPANNVAAVLAIFKPAAGAGTAWTAAGSSVATSAAAAVPGRKRPASGNASATSAAAAIPGGGTAWPATGASVAASSAAAIPGRKRPGAAAATATALTAAPPARARTAAAIAAAASATAAIPHRSRTAAATAAAASATAARPAELYAGRALSAASSYATASGAAGRTASRTAAASQTHTYTIASECRTLTTNPGDPAMLTMTHDPAATLPYAVDWQAWLAPGDTITASNWSLTAMPASRHERPPYPMPPVQQTFENTGLCTVWIGPAHAEAFILATNMITTAAGQQDERSIQLQVRQR